VNAENAVAAPDCCKIDREQEIICLWRKSTGAQLLRLTALFDWRMRFSENRCPLCANVALRVRRMRLYAADRLQPRPRMNFGLRQHGRLLPESLDQRAHEGADPRRGYQHRRLALARGALEGVAHAAHELRQL